MGFPANLGTIEPGETANFEAVASDLDTLDQLQNYKYEITYLEE